MTKALAKIAFCSCSYVQVRKRQIAWTWIAQEEPDLLILLGDTVYAQNSKWNLDYLQRQYDEQWRIGNFRELLEAVPHLATWDDHDFGPGNAKGGTAAAQETGITGVERRQEARNIFRTFLSPSVPNADNLSTVPEEIYCSYILNNILIIILDGRYYREDADGNPQAEFLGRDQTDWLWREMDRAKTGGYKATVVCSGSTIDSSNAPSESMSHYTNFYAEFEKRFRACPNPIFLSGDLHQNRIRVHDGFLELISSGVAQQRGSKSGERKNLDNRGILHIHEDHIRVRLRGSDQGNEAFDFPLSETLPSKMHLNNVVWREQRLGKK